MKTALDATHDPSLRSWVDSAGAPDTDFPIQNLPFGVFRGNAPGPRVGVAIGEHVLDVTACAKAGLLDGTERAVAACNAPSLNRLMALPSRDLRALRAALSGLLKDGSPAGSAARAAKASILHPIKGVELLLPVEIGDYTDFYASVHHATNVGGMFRPDNPLLPNYKHVPIGYHGRASSIVVSSERVRRPNGQTQAGDAPPTFGPTRQLDYEAELGFYIGVANALGHTVPISHASDHIFGFTLVNDWSARDIQRWEYQPLGPFLAKNFQTTVSPWVVTADALMPFRTRAYARPDGDPAPLPYLHDSDDQREGGLLVKLEVSIRSEAMSEAGHPAMRLSRAEFTDMYWTPAQMLAHHTSNGCNLRPGDLLASGTVSGTSKDSRGCMLELTWRGTEPLTLPSGETRTFLEDGDEIIMHGFAEREGAVRIGFGECAGTVLPSSSGHY